MKMPDDLDKAGGVRPDRKGKRTLVAHVELELYRHFKILTAAQLATTDAMMHEALYLLFERYNELETLRRKLAELSTVDPSRSVGG
jgi:hypothetical protein